MILPKLDFWDCTLPKSYHSITLLSYLSKGLEYLIAKHLSY